MARSFLFSKSHWSKFTYGLLYPGFLGSMFYELMPANRMDLSLSHFDLTWIIECIITCFYMLDYFHLYGDMNELVENNRRDYIYVVCDIMSSVSFFLAFLLVKLDYFAQAIIVISLIPLFFLFYKRHNKYDRFFYLPYTFVSLTTGFLFAVFFMYNKPGQIVNADAFLFGFAAISFSIYLFYCLIYYPYKSQEIDMVLYSGKKRKTKIVD